MTLLDAMIVGGLTFAPLWTWFGIQVGRMREADERDARR